MNGYFYIKPDMIMRVQTFSLKTERIFPIIEGIKKNNTLNSKICIDNKKFT